MGQIVQVIIVIALTGVAAWALLHWARRGRSEVFQDFGGRIADGLPGPAWLRRPSWEGGSSKAGLGRALAYSLSGEKTWFSKQLKVTSGRYVIFASQQDYLKVCAHLGDLVNDVIEYLHSESKAGRIVLACRRNASGQMEPFELDVVQVLCRDHVRAGQPQLSAYATARAEELARQQTAEQGGMEWQPPVNRLLEPDELDGGLSAQESGVHPLTGSHSAPSAELDFAEFEASASGPAWASSHGSLVDAPPFTAPSGFQSSATARALETPSGMAHLEVLEAPEGVDMPSYLTMTNGAVYGRSSELGPAAIPVGRVSRQQFALHREAGAWWLQDLSSNGTMVNDEIVDGPVRLDHGDTISLSDCVALAVRMPRGDLPTDR